MRYATSNDGAEFDADNNGNADDITSSTNTTQEEAKYYPIPTFYKEGCENVTYLPPHIQRVLCLSDLHTDHVDNIAWLANRTRRGDISQNDLLVVAGDISHDLNRIEESLALLLKTNATVLFVAGNHEAWLSSKELQHIKRVRKQQQQSSVFTKPIIHTLRTQKVLSSIEKLERVYDLCHRMGVLTGCTVVGHPHDDGKNDDLATTSHLLWIVPLDSWYDGSLAIQECNELIQDFPKWPWVDFLRCSWWPYFPKNTKRNRRLLQKIPDGLVTYFLQQNQKAIQQFQKAIFTLETKQQHQQQQQYPPTTSSGLMTVSHFLPKQQCLPDWKDVSSTTFDAHSWLNHGGGGVSAKFALVAGTKALDEQIRSLQQPQQQQQQHLLTANNRQNPPPLLRHIHVFGHSHRPKDFECDGIRYIHNPLGKPREREIHMINPHVDFQLVWDTTMGEVKGETLIRYWEEKGGGVEMLRQRMQRSQRRPSRYSVDSKKVAATLTKDENVTLPNPQRQPQTHSKHKS